MTQPLKPIDAGEVQLGIGGLPQQKIADAQLAAGANQQVRVRHMGQGQRPVNRRFGGCCDVCRFNGIAATIGQLG